MKVDDPMLRGFLKYLRSYYGKGFGAFKMPTDLYRGVNPMIAPASPGGVPTVEKTIEEMNMLFGPAQGNSLP